MYGWFNWVRKTRLSISDPQCGTNEKCTEPAFVMSAESKIDSQVVNMPFVSKVRGILILLHLFWQYPPFKPFFSSGPFHNYEGTL